MYHRQLARLVDALRRRHGSLDGEGANILPSLLQKRDQVINRQHDVTNKLILSHANISNGNTHAQHLLKLKLDGALNIGDFVVEVFSVGHWSGEFASFGETGAEETGDLLNEGVGGDEGIVFAGELLDELLVLVELLQVVGGHGVDTMMLGSINVVLVTKNADAHSGSWNFGKLDGPGETLITLGIIVLETDLEFNSLQKVALLGFCAVFEQLLNILAHTGDSDL